MVSGALLAHEDAAAGIGCAPLTVGRRPVLSTRPQFEWHAVSGATSYTLQVSTAPTFSSYKVNATVTGTMYIPVVDMPRGVTVYWRMKANGTNPSDWSASQSFTGANPPAVPVLVAPANALVLTTYTPTLDWNEPVGSDQYQVQIATTSTFSVGTIVQDAFRTGLTSSNYLATPLAENTTFYWRVRTYNIAGEYSQWSAARSFRTKLRPPVLVSPIDPLTPVVLRPTFTWTGVSGATGYVIQVSKSSTFSSLLVNATVVGTSYTPASNLPANQTLYWRVYTRGANPSPWSEAAQFHTQ